MKSSLVLLLVIATTVCLAVVVSQSRAASGSGSGAQATIPNLNVGIAESIPTLDAARHTTNASGQIDALGLEQLMKVGPTGSVQPNLAKSVSHPNPFTYIYTLRKGIKFWDGNEMTSADVANALNYYRYPSFQSASYYTSVRSVKASGRYSVIVTLKHPDASWQFVPTFESGIFEKKFADAHPGTMGQPGVLTMGTGPWEFDSLDPTSGLELSANPHYWGGNVPIQHISVKFLSDQTSEALAFRAGQIDVAFPGDGRAFASTSGAKITSAPDCLAYMISMNYHLAPWSDVHVRRAVAYATDRAGMASAIGGVTPITTFIPPQMLYDIAPKAAVDKALKPLPTYAFDLTKAKQELAKSAYPHGFTATLNAPNIENLPVIDQALAANLQKIGIHLQIATVPTSQWIAQFYGPRNEIPIFVTDSGCATPDPSWYPGLFLDSKTAVTGGINLADYTKPAVDNLIKLALGTNDSAKRLADYTKLLQIVGADVPYVPLFTKDASLALSSKFTWPGFYTLSLYGPWALNIKSK